MQTAVMFSKASDEWSTPLEFWNGLDEEFHFTLDAAATAENTLCDQWFGLGGVTSDALTARWPTSGAIWLNPPYSKCREFIAKAADAAKHGATVVCLVPSRTDTRWFHEHVWDRSQHVARPGVEIRFLKGRLTFGGASAGAPFPSVVIIFRGTTSRGA